MICGKQKATPTVVDVQGGNMETAVAIHRNTHHSFVEAITYQFRSKPISSTNKYRFRIASTQISTSIDLAANLPSNSTDDLQSSPQLTRWCHTHADISHIVKIKGV
jgi:hypothetical protein